MSKTLYIHMGMYKTGTKSVQFFFTEHRAFFMRQGLYYPPAGGVDFYRHKAFFPIREKALRRVVRTAEKHGCRSILLSSDSLCRTGLDAACLARIRQVAPDYAVKYIIYVKRIDDMLHEWYNESRKRNYFTKSYNDFVDFQFRNGRTILFPSKLLDTCAAQIGKEKLIVRNYSLIRDTVGDICTLLGVETAAASLPKTVYNGHSPEGAIPYYTPSLFSRIPYGYTELALQKKLRDAFAAAQDTTPHPQMARSAVREIRHVTREYLPGYARQFARRPLRMNFPEAQADPYAIYTAELLHSIYKRVHWPERLVWRAVSLGYLLLVQIPFLQKRLLRFIPFIDKKRAQ